MEESGFSYGCYLKFQRERVLSRSTPRSRTTSVGLMEQSGPRLRTVWGMSVAGVRRRLNQVSSVLEALSFRCTDAHHACISKEKASKRDLALTMSLAESLMYSCASSPDDTQL